MTSLGTLTVDTASQPVLDYFSMFGNANPTFDNRYKYSTFTTVYPEVTSESNYRFSMHTDYGHTVLDLKKILLVTKVTITDSKGQALAPNTVACPTNNLLYSMWRSIKVYCNNVCLMSMPNYGVYQAIRSMFESSAADKKSHMTKALFFEDSETFYDTLSESNSGYLSRREPFGIEASDGTFVWNDNEVTMCGVLNTTLPNISYQPYPCEIKIDMEKHNDAFCLQAAPMNDPKKHLDIKLNIKSVVMHVLTYSLTESVFLKIVEKMNKESLRYYMNDCQVAIYTVASGTEHHIIESLSVGRIPKQIIFATQTSDRYHGCLEKNSLRFPKYFEAPDGSGDTPASNLLSVKLTVGHTEVDGLWVEKPSSDYAVNYYKYFMLNDMLAGGHNLPSDLSPTRFISDFHTHFFDLGVSLNQSPEWCKQPVKAGAMRAYFQFSRPTPTPVTIFALIISDACIVMDKAGRVTKETT